MSKKAGNIFGGLKSFLNIGKLFKGGGGSGWIFGLILIASLLKKKKKPKAPEVVSNYDSPTYSFGGGIATTISTDNSPIPLVYGHHMVGGNIVNSFISSNSLYETEETVQVSSTAIQYVSHDLTTGVSIYKIASCPVMDVVDVKVQVPHTLFTPLTNINMYNRNLNTSLLIQYSYDGFTYYDGLRITLWDHAKDYGRITNSAAEARVQNKTFRLGIKNTAVQDIYFRNVIENYTIYQYTGNYGSYGSNIKTKETSVLLYLNDYVKLTAAYYSVTKTIINNTAANQRLYMDVVLSAGEIRNLRSIQVNDRFVSDYLTDNKQEGIERSTKYRFRPGFASYADMNTEGTLTVQSTVYNQNDVAVSKNVGSVVTTDLPIASNTQRAMIDDDTAFYVGAYIALVACATDGNRPSSSQYVTATGTGYIDCAVPWGAYKAGQPLYISDAMSATYTDFQYTTQGEQIDCVVVGLNAPEGLYNTNTETGALYAKDCLVTVKVAHATLSSGTATSFPLSTVPTEQLLVNKQITLRGAKRSKIWYDQVFTKELVPNPFNGDKKYLIEMRKDSDNTLSEYSKNALQVAYVEELVNKELAYNGCAYVGLEITANAKVNTSTPNFKFEVDGMLVPTPINNSLMVKAASSTTTKVVMEFNPAYGTSTNYENASGTSFALNGFLMSVGGKVYSMLDDQAYLFYDGSTVFQSYNNFAYRTLPSGTDGNYGWPYFTAYFLCGDSWYRRYVRVRQERVPGAPLPPTSPLHLQNYFEIITDFTPAAVDPVNNYAGYLDTVWLKETNTALPSVPTDVLLYQWSDNPAWIVLHMLCDEDNGAGIPFENIDLESFREAAAYFSEYIDNPITSVVGDKIKRCAINYIVDSYGDLRTHIEKVLTLCHGALYNSNNKIKFLVERELNDAEFLVSLDESTDLTELSVTTVPSKELPNQLVVSFLDENAKFEKRNIVVEDASLSKSRGYLAAVKQDIDLYGLTTESHVLMEAMRMIKGAKYTRFAIQLKTALSALPLEIYDGFKLTAATYGWTNKKFRCVGVRINDKLECEIDATEYFDDIYRLDTDDLVKYHEINHTELPSLTEIPSPVTGLVLIEEAVRNNAGNVQVNLVGHFSAPQGITFDPSSGTVLTNSKYEYNKMDHVFVTLYHKSTISDSYRVIREKVRFDGEEFRFNNLEIGAYYYAVVEAASLANAIGAPVSSAAIQLTGKALPPLDITYAAWTRDETDYSRYKLTWTPNTTDFDMATYRVRFATATGSWDTYEYQLNVPSSLSAFDFVFFKDQGINYYGGDFGKTTDTNFQIIIKCVDTSGNESLYGYTLTASATLEPDNVTSLAINSYNGDDDYPINIVWARPTGDNVIRYEVKVGSATSTWDNAEYTFNTKNVSLYLDHGDISGLLASQTGIKAMVKGYNFFDRASTGASATKTLVLAPTAATGGTLTLSTSGDLWTRLPAAPSNVDFLYYKTAISSSSDATDTTSYHVWHNLPAQATHRMMLVTPDMDGKTLYQHYQAVDKYFYRSAWNSSATLAVDVIPAVVSSTQMKYKVTNNGISLLLPDKSQELSWDYYDVHISSATSFTPDVTNSSPTRVAVGKTNKFEINQFNDGTALESAQTYYLKVRSLSKYAPTTETYHSDFNEADLEVTTSDATAPVLIVDAITPSISPINIIIGDTLLVDYTVSDNGSIDRTRGRVYHVDHLASATWIDPLDEDSHTFDLFPSSTDGSYVIQMQTFDSQGNYSSYTNYFSRDTAVASAPASVSATQINTTGVQVTIEAPTGTINIKEYVVEYAIDTGSGYSAWSEIRRTNATTFVESLAVAGDVKFRVKTTKVHTATLDSGYTESTPITMDSVGPSLVIDYTTPDIFLDSLLTSNDVTFHFITSDTIGLQATDPVKYSLDSGVFTTSTTLSMNASGTAASGTVVLTDIADGSHYITFRSYDEVGNTKDTNVYYFEIDTAVPADLDTPTVAVNGRVITITVPDFTPDANFSHVEYAIFNADTDAEIVTFKK